MKVGYSKTYPLSQYWEKNWLEDDIPTGLTIDSTDEEIEAVMKKVRRIQYALKKQVESFHYEALAAMEKQMGTHVVEEVPYSDNNSLTKVANLIKQISTCQALKILESYKLIVRGDEDLQAAYDKRHKELSEIAMKYIQDTSNSNK